MVAERITQAGCLYSNLYLTINLNQFIHNNEDWCVEDLSYSSHVIV